MNIFQIIINRKAFTTIKVAESANYLMQSVDDFNPTS